MYVSQRIRKFNFALMRFIFSDFSANTGGLLGLFMGFSVVSIIELIYFLTFRPYCAQQRVDDDEQQFDQNERFATAAAVTEAKKSKTQLIIVWVKRFAARIRRRIMSILPVNDNRAFYPYMDWIWIPIYWHSFSIWSILLKINRNRNTLGTNVFNFHSIDFIVTSVKNK